MLIKKLAALIRLRAASPPPLPPPPPAVTSTYLSICALICTTLVVIVLLLLLLRATLRRHACAILPRGRSPAPLAPTSVLKDGFASRKLPDEIDCVIIGSGISGLLTGALLSRLGHKVLVLEQHDQAGGCTHTFDEHGFEFDTGLHYVGDILGVLLNAGTTGTIEWASTGDITDEVVVGAERVPIRCPQTAFFSELHERFPAEKAAIRRYATKLGTAKLALMARLLLKLVPYSVHAALAPLVNRLLPLQTTLEVLTTLTSDSKLVGLLSYIWGTFGLPPSRSPFAMTAIIQTHYFNGAYYPVGGCAQLAARLIPTITAGGGRVLVRAPVTRFLFDRPGGRVIGVEVKGREVYAKRVVSAAGMLNTLRLCPSAECPRLHMLGSVLRDGAPLRCDGAAADDGTIEPSNSFVYLFVGLAGADELLEAALVQHNLWVLPSWSHEADSALPRTISGAEEHPMLVFISSPSAKDPAWSQRHPGKQVIVALAPTRFEYWSDRADGERVHHRGAAYDAFKAAMKARMLAALLEQMPAIAPYVAYSSLGSPLSSNFFLGTHWGESYGLEHSARRFNQPCLRPRSPLTNLYLTGQDLFTDGVAGGAISAFVTASCIDPRVPLMNAGCLAALMAAS